MRNWKKIIGAGLLGFLAFAPPGTLIAIFLFLVWLVGDVRFVIASFVIIAVGGAVIFFWRRKSAKEKEVLPAKDTKDTKDTKINQKPF